MKKPLHEFESPIPIHGKPRNCVELTIYDDDGPEGFFQRWRFERSADAIKMILDHFEEMEIKDYNFEIVNHYKHD